MDQKLSGTPLSSIGGGRGDDGDGGGGSRGGCDLLSLPLDSSTMTRTSLTPPLLRRSNSFALVFDRCTNTSINAGT